MEVKVYVNDVEVAKGNENGIGFIQKGTTNSRFNVIYVVYGRKGDWATISERTLNGESRIRVQFSREIEDVGERNGFTKKSNYHYSAVVDNADVEEYLEYGKELAFELLS